MDLVEPMQQPTDKTKKGKKDNQRSADTDGNELSQQQKNSTAPTEEDSTKVAATTKRKAESTTTQSRPPKKSARTSLGDVAFIHGGKKM